MSFTYVLSTALGQLRLALGDTTETSGPRPDGSNFQDEELQVFLTLEENDVDRATARACETLATQWAAMSDLTVGPRSEKLSQVAARYAEQARALRGATLQAGYITLGSVETDE